MIQDIEAVHQATAIYTSEHVVDDLLDMVGFDGHSLTLLDPSAGDGAVVARAMRRVAPTPGDFVRAAMVIGWEFHEGAAAEAIDRVRHTLLDLGWNEDEALAAATASIQEKDFLLLPPSDLFDVVVGNPPYLRTAKLPSRLKARYGEIVNDYARGDLLHAFLDACCRVIRPGGRIAFVTADRWLFNESAGRLRSALGVHVGIEHVSRLDPATSFYRPKDRRRGSPPRVHPVKVVLHADADRLDREPVSPDGLVAVPSDRALERIASIRIAPWLGPAGIFVIDESDRALFPGADLVPAVDTDDIDPSTDELHTPSRLVIRTSRDARPSDDVMSHLAVAVERLSPRGRRTPMWLPPETITLPLDRPSLLVPRIARRVRVIELPAGVLPINHNLSVAAAIDGVSLDDLKRLLLDEQSQAWVAANAAPLENGYLSITTKLLRRMPLPDWWKA